MINREFVDVFVRHTTDSPHDNDICDAEPEYNGMLMARISSIFVIGLITFAGTILPILAIRHQRFKVPYGVYNFSRFFGAGVLLSFSLVHLLVPAIEAFDFLSICYSENWKLFDWASALILCTIFTTFTVNTLASWIIERKYANYDAESSITKDEIPSESQLAKENGKETLAALAALLILEFGVVLHSVILGLNLGTAGKEFKTFYAVIIFHQTFEGLGLGARIASIPFAKGSWLPTILTIVYSSTVPVATAIGLIVRNVWSQNLYSAKVSSAILDSISCAIILYAALIEFLARDFIYKRDTGLDSLSIAYRLTLVALGAGIMALIGKWI